MSALGEVPRSVSHFCQVAVTTFGLDYFFNCVVRKLAVELNERAMFNQRSFQSINEK